MMPTVPQRFRHCRSAGAFLRGAWGVDPDPDSHSLSRCRKQDPEKGPPSRVLARLSQHASGQPFDIQVFDYDQAITLDQHSCDLVMKIAALAANMRMHPLQDLHGLASPMTPLLPASHAALGTAQPSLSPNEYKFT